MPRAANLDPVDDGPFGPEGGGGQHPAPPTPEAAVPAKWTPPEFQVLYPQVLASGQPDPESMHSVANEMWREGWDHAVAAGKQFDVTALRNAYLALTPQQLMLCELASRASLPDPMASAEFTGMGLHVGDYRKGGSQYAAYTQIMAALQTVFIPPINSVTTATGPAAGSISERLATLEHQVAAIRHELGLV